MLRYLLLILVLGFFSIQSAVCQDGPVIKFERLQHDFGKIKEDGGSVVTSYKFTNTGNKPLIINRVQPGCGCTTPDWSKEEIKPGKDGFVKATFDPMGRAGLFNKNIAVYTNGEPNVVLLTFTGEVTPRTRTYVDTFPAVSGNLRYILNHINFGSIKNNVTDTVGYLTLYNQGSKPIVIKELAGPSFITAQLPFTVYPKVATKFALHFNASAVSDFGMAFQSMKLKTDDEIEPNKPISVIADLHKFVPKLSDKELAQSPKIEFEKTEHNFGDIKQGDVVKTTFKFTNKGKSPLEILQVKTTCGCTVAELADKVIKPGKSAEINVSFSSAGKSGDEKKDIMLITNDPKNPEPSLRIRAKILVPKG